MSTKDRWIKLFEQVVGRKPTMQEFLMGKESHFDFKQIKSIAEQASSTNVTEVTPPTTSKTNVKIFSKTLKRLALAGLIVLGLSFATVSYFFYQTTNPQTLISSFSDAFATNDYAAIAKQFSDDTSSWNAEDVKNFLTYLEDKGINPVTELRKLAEDDKKDAYSDEKGNQLFGLEKEKASIPFLSHYRIKTFPLQVTLNTNLDKLTVNGETVLETNPYQLDHLTFKPQSLKIVAETEIGEWTEVVDLDLSQSVKNHLKLDLLTKQHKISAKLGDLTDQIETIELFINDIKISDTLTADIDVFENQELSLFAKLAYKGKWYQTEKMTFTIKSNPETTINLDLPEELNTEILKNKETETKVTTNTQETENDHESIDRSVDTKNLTTAQCAAWAKAYTAKRYGQPFTSLDFTSLVTDILSSPDGLVYIEVRENHDSPTMRSRGADPNVAPLAGRYRINILGQLEEQDIISQEYRVVASTYFE